MDRERIGEKYNLVGGGGGGGLPCSKESTCNAGDMGDGGLIPGSGRSPGEGHGSPLQYLCLKNPMVRGAWLDTVHRVTRLGHD